MAGYWKDCNYKVPEQTSNESVFQTVGKSNKIHLLVKDDLQKRI